MVTRGFFGRKPSEDVAARLPPGQYLERGFPVLSAGPTPRVETTRWRFDLKSGPKLVKSWSWEEFNRLPRTTVRTDIHCVTKWSKFDTNWEGVTIDTILADAGITAPPTPFVLAHSFDDYSTNVPFADLTGDKGMVATRYEGQPIAAVALRLQRLQFGARGAGRSTERGYASVEVTPRQVSVRLQTVDRPLDPDSGVTTAARFVVEAGHPGPVAA